MFDGSTSPQIWRVFFPRHVLTALEISVELEMLVEAQRERLPQSSPDPGQALFEGTYSHIPKFKNRSREPVHSPFDDNLSFL